MKAVATAAIAAVVGAVSLLLPAASAGRESAGGIEIGFPPLPAAPAGTALVLPIHVVNRWPGQAVGVTMTLSAPAWVRLAAARCTARPARLRCPLPDLAAGATRTVSVTVRPMRRGRYSVRVQVAVREVRLPDTRAPTAAHAFRASVAPISPALARRMTGVSWHPGCPVALRDLRAVTVSYHGFDGAVRRGTLIVDRAVAASVVRIMGRLFAAGFPIRRIAPVDAYGGDDFRSIEADNTSAFNCRPVAGTSRWSEHAYGRAIDLDPLENPYVSAGATSHPASRRYLDRTLRLPGMLHPGDEAVSAFAAEGWGWGGAWSGERDYQHFSVSGR